MAGHLEQRLAVQQHIAATGPYQAADGEQGCALARPIGAQQRHDLALVHMQIDAVQGLHIAVADPNVLQLKHGHA